MKVRKVRGVGAAVAALTVLAAGGVFVRTAQAAPPDVKQLVSVQVLPEKATYAPGKPVRVAVRLKIAEGWHVYWLNPGDAGMTAACHLKLPAGWTQGEWEYPLPRTFTDDAGLVAYGYAGEVVLFTTVTPAPTTTGEVSLHADVVFLVCKDLCLPGRESGDVLLSPVGEGAAAPADPVGPLHESWKSRLPAGEAIRATPLTSEPPSAAGWTTVRYEIADVELGKAKSVTAYPLPSEEMEYRSIGVDLSGSRPIINMELKLYAGRTVVPPKLRALLVSESTSGERSGRWAEFSLPGAAADAATAKP